MTKEYKKEELILLAKILSSQLIVIVKQPIAERHILGQIESCALFFINQVLETETVKEPCTCPKGGVYSDGRVCEKCNGTEWIPTPPSNSEKEECCRLLELQTKCRDEDIEELLAIKEHHEKYHKDCHQEDVKEEDGRTSKIEIVFGTKECKEKFEAGYSYRDHYHCPEKDSPCGMQGKHRCCLCGLEPTVGKRFGH